MLIWLLLLLLLSPSAGFTEGCVASQSMASGDSAYAQRQDLSQTKLALEKYQESIACADATAVNDWKASRAAWWIADHAEKRSEKLTMFQKGIDHAKAGIARDPNCVECHLWLGYNYGSYGETKGVLKSLFLVKPIRHEMETAIQLNERADGGGGWRVLGVVDYQVPGFAGGNKKRALEELNKSLAIDPNNPFTHYYLAEYYKTIGEKDQMKTAWEEMKVLNVAEELKPEYADLLHKGEKPFGK